MCENGRTTIAVLARMAWANGCGEQQAARCFWVVSGASRAGFSPHFLNDFGIVFMLTISTDRASSKVDGFVFFV